MALRVVSSSSELAGLSPGCRRRDDLGLLTAKRQQLGISVRLWGEKWHVAARRGDRLAILIMFRLVLIPSGPDSKDESQPTSRMAPLSDC